MRVRIQLPDDTRIRLVGALTVTVDEGHVRIVADRIVLAAATGAITVLADEDHSPPTARKPDAAPS